MNTAGEGSSGAFLVVLNYEGQHSLWPRIAPIPDGWEQVYGPASRQACLDYVDRNWSADVEERAATA